MLLLSVSSIMADEQLHSYKEWLNDIDLIDLVKEFFSYLDYTEESESGREFHPVTIGSCRCLMTEPLNCLLTELRRRIHAPIRSR